jgi:hypothetical protein
MYLSDFYLGRTININQRCIHSCFIILDNVKSVNWPRECSINAAGTTMYGRHHLDCYYINFSCFPWQEFVWWYVLLFFCLLGLANYSRGYAFLCVIWSIVSVTPSRALIYESFRINELRGVAFTKYYYIEIARKRYFNVP